MHKNMDNFLIGFALGLVLVSVGVKACTTEVHLASKHQGAEEFNEKNLGLGRECGGWQYGFYENSLNRTSLYVGKLYRFNKHTGLKLGLVSGYPESSVFAAGYIRVLNNELTVIPPTKYGPLTVGYSLRF